MKLLHLSVIAFLALSLSACNSPPPDRTHEGGLLDDKVTTERVSAALQRGGPDFRRIQVQTPTEGHVVLSGRVRSPEVKQRAEDLARATGRVKRLDDNIEIETDVPPARAR
jgi:osmotically-inducible protein OsmY